MLKRQFSQTTREIVNDPDRARARAQAPVTAVYDAKAEAARLLGSLAEREPDRQDDVRLSRVTASRDRIDFLEGLIREQEEATAMMMPKKSVDFNEMAQDLRTRCTAVSIGGNLRCWLKKDHSDLHGSCYSQPKTVKNLDKWWQ